jgi:hypothetical protein
VRATLRERLVEAHLLPALRRVRWDVLHADWLAGAAMCLAIVVAFLALVSVTDFYQLFADDQVELEHAAMDARETAWNGAIAALEAWADAADEIDEAIERAVALREREGKAARGDAKHGELSFIYRYILRESCSQFDSLPLTSLTFLSLAGRHGARRCARVDSGRRGTRPTSAAPRPKRRGSRWRSCG